MEHEYDNPFKAILAQKHFTNISLYFSSGFPEQFDKVVKCQMLFSVKHVCESVCSVLAACKVKYRNKAEMGHYMRLKLASLELSVVSLSDSVQTFKHTSSGMTNIISYTHTLLFFKRI
jgi:hypothetical protein